MRPAGGNVIFSVLVFCVPRFLCYNYQRVEARDEHQTNYEIDSYTDFETKKFLEIIKRMESIGEPEGGYSDFAPSRTTPQPPKDDSAPLDSWSVVWYIASFGGLIAFFLIVSCSEWCCRRHARNNPNCRRNENIPQTAVTTDTPPPSYDQFAPPSYESICLGRNGSGSEKQDYDIYVVPIHSLGTMMEAEARQEAPPSYITAATFNHVHPPQQVTQHIPVT